MPTIKYSNNPNSDTAFVIQDGGQKNRTVLTAEPAGTLQLSDSANVSTGYVTDEDGKKHKVNLVAQLEGDIEFSENPNSTKGYATVDGKKHRVVLTASLHGGGGSAPVIDELNVTPSTSAQTITAPSGTDGYSPVNVAAVTSAIDANIVAGNIKKDVSILGVTGSYEGVAPSGTKLITSNGIQDVAGYANADVQVPTTAPDMYIAYNLSPTGVASKGESHFSFDRITDVANNCFYETFVNDTSLTGLIDLSNLTSISGNNGFDSTFQGCSNITGVNLSSLTSITGSYGAVNMFRDCTGFNSSVDLSSLTSVTGSYALQSAFSGSSITGIDLSALTTISSYGCQYMCKSCTHLTGTIDLSSLTTVGIHSCQEMFYGCTGLTGHIDLSSLTTISNEYACASMFDGCSSITSVDLSNLTSITGSNSCEFMFRNCTGLTGHIDLSNITNIGSAYAGNSIFEGCTGITSVDLSGLKQVTGGYNINNIFKGCTSLTTFDISSLVVIGYGSWVAGTICENCTNLTNVKLDSLSVINSYGAFERAFGNTALTSLSFPALASSGNNGIFRNIIQNVSGCTIHFPKNLDPQTGSAVISGLNTYPNFGGTNTVLAFDLPATNTLTGADTVTYTRNPKYDTATALAWKAGDYSSLNLTPAYYTSGTTDPVVNDTIYSDSACTQVITSISSVS